MQGAVGDAWKLLGKCPRMEAGGRYGFHGDTAGLSQYRLLSLCPTLPWVAPVFHALLSTSMTREEISTVSLPCQ